MRPTKPAEFKDAMRDFDWANTDAAQHLAIVRRANPADMCTILRRYNWDHHPEVVVGWIAAQQGIDLSAVMTAFFNADPMRFNYMPGRDVPAAHRGVCRVLDAILQRVNAGFYLPDTTPRCDRLAKLDAWIFYQQEDDNEARRGRWVFDEAMLKPLFHVNEAQVSGAQTAKLDEDKMQFLGFDVPKILQSYRSVSGK